ncbi:MAG: putative DNA-binding domain-containing protein [Hyphomicrobiales bacterium]|nr:putative DNA-binding domain-containing protein [Hyphomicrobiales bacterium]MCP5371881.1 putative DNA-binding domain-containing protein [Hyphomicrobiales bacterium]
MPALPDLQHSFMAALRGGAEDAVLAAIAGDGIPAAERLAIHRNNMVLTLTDSLAGVFPAVRGLVGADFFAACAAAFIAAHPPRSGTLIRYGDRFAPFLDRSGMAAPVPCLSDLARLEWAWHQAFHAADAAPLAPADLGAIDPGDLPALVLRPHPSARLLSSPWPVDAVWAAGLAGDAFDGTVDLDAGGVDLLVVRPALEVEVRRLDPAAAALLAACAAGRPLAEAAATAGTGLDLAAALAGLLAAGAFAPFHPTNQEHLP